jgi:hypothetical protein
VILCRAIITCFLLVVVTPARAQPAKSRADASYDEGRVLIAANKIAEACAAFEDSLKLDPAITTLIALATCRERLGELATAMELFLQAEQQAHSAGGPQASQLQKIARERAAGLNPRVSRLTISVSEQNKLDQLEIWRDGDPVPAEKWNQALPIDGGTYTISARAPGAKEWSIQVTLAVEADAKTIEFPDFRSLRDISQDSDGQPSGTKPTTSSIRVVAASAKPEASDTVRRHGGVLPIAVGSGAVVLLGGALGVSLWGDATYDKAKTEMTDQARRDALQDSANRKRYVAGGLAVGGVGCMGVAVWLYLRTRSAKDVTTSAGTAKLMFVASVSSIGVLGQF